jgi:hypothetical protein
MLNVPEARVGRIEQGAREIASRVDAFDAIFAVES